MRPASAHTLSTNTTRLRRAAMAATRRATLVPPVPLAALLTLLRIALEQAGRGAGRRLHLAVGGAHRRLGVMLGVPQDGRLVLPAGLGGLPGGQGRLELALGLKVADSLDPAIPGPGDDPF